MKLYQSIYLFFILLGWGVFTPLAQATPPLQKTTDDGWHIAHLGGTFDHIIMNQAGEGWIVDYAGTLHRYDGSRWVFEHDFANFLVFDAVMLAPDNVWLAGWQLDQPACPKKSDLSPVRQTTTCGNGAIWHYDGQKWKQVSIPAVNILRHLSLPSPTEGWAISADDKTLQYDGQNWIVVETKLPDISIQDMVVRANNDVWVVEAQGIHHYNGKEWIQVSQLTELNRLFMLSATEGWAVGPSGKIAHYSGSTWQYVDSPAKDGRVGFFDLDFITPTNGWAVGSQGNIVHYDGNSWQLVDSPTDKDLQGIKMLSATEGWAVGWNTLLYYDGTQWQEKTDLLSPTTLTAVPLRTVNFTDPAHGWAFAGKDSPIPVDIGAILQYDKGQWKNLTDKTTQAITFTGVDMLSPTDGWATGRKNRGFTQGMLFQYDGQQWQRNAIRLNGNRFNRIDMVTSDRGWAVGYGTVPSRGSKILEYKGDKWELVESQGVSELYDVSMISAEEGWAVGGIPFSTFGEIHHYKDNRWQLVNRPNTKILLAVSMLSPTEGWAVGTETILRYDGSTWQDVVPLSTSLKGYRLYDIEMVSANDGWIVGSDGLILHYDGQNWKRVASPTQLDLFALDMVTSYHGWIVGTNGLILKYGDEGQSTYLPTVLGR